MIEQRGIKRTEWIGSIRWEEEDRQAYASDNVGANQTHRTHHRDRKILNFPVGRLLRAKTEELRKLFSRHLRPNCVNDFRDIYYQSVYMVFVTSKVSFPTISRQSGNCPDTLETFQTVWKLSRLSGNLPDCPETVQTVLKLSRLSRNCPNWAETFQTVRKLSRLSGNFRPFLENSPHCLKNFYSVQALFEF